MMNAHPFRRIYAISILLLGVGHERAVAQCSSIVSTPAEASACAGRAIPDPKVTVIDRQHQYSLVELIDNRGTQPSNNQSDVGTG
ncbi:MAG: hypothetical protein C5B51_25280 [Terriglobia bacterium]|nr:MAG: hypothetical protein C5B51_25280 [Terriglobia bacterium]